jgi:hypothetical protein
MPSRVFAALLALHLFAETKEADRRLAAPPHHGGRVVRAMKYSASGISAGLVSAGGGDATRRLGTIGVHSEQLGYGYDRGLDVRVANSFDLGGDVRGFHGGLMGDLSGGYRFGESDTHGPLVRGGIALALRGDQLVYQSLLELPQAQIGYQYVTADTVIDVAPRLGFVILGQSNTGDQASRKLDLGLDAGATGALRVGPIMARASWSHLLPHSSGGAVDWVGLGLCGRTALVLCTTASFVTGDVHLPGGSIVGSHVTEITFTIGLGDR